MDGNTSTSYASMKITTSSSGTGVAVVEELWSEVVVEVVLEVVLVSVVV